MESRTLTKLMRFTMSVVVLCALFPFLYSQTTDTRVSDANKSWTSTAESLIFNVNPTRTTEFHSQSGNRTVDRQNVESLGPDGHYEPLFDVEKETIQTSPTTGRTVVRTFGRDGSGQRILTSVTEENREDLGGGNERVLRVTSNPDWDGRLQIVRRDVTDAKKISADIRESKTTVFLSDGTGVMAPSMQIRQREQRGGDHTVNVQKSTLLLDGAGNWQVNELKESTIEEKGNERTTEESTSQLGPDYKLRVVSSMLGKESQSSSVEKHNTVETYLLDIPGSGSDGKLHLTQRVSTVSRWHSDGGKQTEQQIEQLNLGDPNAGLRLTIKGADSVQLVPSGTHETRIINIRDAAGSFGVVSVETRKSDKVEPVRVAIPPENKSK
jgi:hypothetical protein